MEELIKFKINSEMSIDIILPCSKENLTACDDVKIIFKSNNKEYLLYDHDTILWALRCLSASLTAALSKRLTLPAFFEGRDIGYMWNLSLHETISLQNERAQKEEEWQDDYLIWNFKEFALWIYNKDNAFCFEVTPVYKWHFDTQKAPAANDSFEEFMASYKPSEIIKIDKEVVENILNQSEDLLKFVNKSL